MKLMSRIRESYNPAAREEREYEELLSRPDHKMLTVILLQALGRGADAICYGFRSDIVEPVGSKEARLESREQFQGWMAIEAMIHPSMRAVRESAFASGPAGETGMPISFRIDGVLQYFNDLPFRLYGTHVKAIQCRSVSIGATKANPQPVRFFEIGTYPGLVDPTAKRRFVEVDQEFQKDNSFWIYLRSEREIEAGIRISQGIR